MSADNVNTIVQILLIVMAVFGAIAATSKERIIKVLGFITLALSLITLVAFAVTPVGALGYTQPQTEVVVRPIWGSLLFGVIGLISLVSGFFLAKNDKASTAMFIAAGIAWLMALVFVGIDMWKLGSLATITGIGFALTWGNGSQGPRWRISFPRRGKSMSPSGPGLSNNNDGKKKVRGSSLPLIILIIILFLLVFFMAGRSASPAPTMPTISNSMQTVNETMLIIFTTLLG